MQNNFYFTLLKKTLIFLKCNIQTDSDTDQSCSSQKEKFLVSFVIMLYILVEGLCQ